MMVAIVTGASRGLGLALTAALAAGDRHVVVDARHGVELHDAVGPLGDRVVAVPGDVADPAHRRALIGAARRIGQLDLVVNNASYLGPSPQPRLADYPLDVYRRVIEVNVVAPLGLAQLAVRDLEEVAGVIVNVTSDAGVEAYEGWGGYGSSKAALEQQTRVFAAEHPAISVYAVDPGDMNTQMHQEAFPGEDLSHLPEPGDSVPAILELIRARLPSGRYAVSDIAVPS